MADWLFNRRRSYVFNKCNSIKGSSKETAQRLAVQSLWVYNYRLVRDSASAALSGKSKAQLAESGHPQSFSDQALYHQ